MSTTTCDVAFSEPDVRTFANNMAASFRPEADLVRERFSALYESHRDSVFHSLLRRGLEAAVAQELVQDVFVDLFLALKKGTEIESAEKWLYFVARRTALDHWRRKRSRTRVEIDSDRSDAADVPSSEPTPEVQAEHKERLTRVAAGLQRLPDEQRACIQLRIQGRRYREIAGTLRISTSTVAEWISSATGRLRVQAEGDRL